MRIDSLLAMTASVALLASGCSLVATKGAPSYATGPTPPGCTTSKLPVYADGAISAGAVGTSAHWTPASAWPVSAPRSHWPTHNKLGCRWWFNPMGVRS